jgi:hypothetical protein
MRRMHKPDPKLGPEAQDKRSVIALEIDEVDRWLHGTLDQATGLLKLALVDCFDAAPAAGEPAGQTSQARLL